MTDMEVDDQGLRGILTTDQYQLTMAQLYWQEGLADRTAQFDYFFRSYPDYGTLIATKASRVKEARSAPMFSNSG